MTHRLDQMTFDLLSAHFESLDEELESLAGTNNMVLKKNELRSPCRVLRRGENPVEIIEVFLEGNWRGLHYQPDMLHGVGIAMYYRTETGDRYCRRTVLVENERFSSIAKRLPEIIADGLSLLDEWQSGLILGRVPPSLSGEWVLVPT